MKGGVIERDPDNYDIAVATANGQNPLMRKYDMAYRYRSYGEFLANVALGSWPLALGASAFYGDDSYLQSDIGLISGLDRRYGLDLTWTVSEKIAAYASLSREKIDSNVSNSSVFAAPDWQGVMQDDYETYGFGVRTQLTDKIAPESRLHVRTGQHAHDIEGARWRFVPDDQERPEFVQGRRAVQGQRPHGPRRDVVVRDVRDPATGPTLHNQT